jgi:hypothetical protein
VTKDGMTLRQWYAGLAMQGLLSNQNFMIEHLKDCEIKQIDNPDMIRGLFSHTCFRLADAMIAVSEEE